MGIGSVSVAGVTLLVVLWTGATVGVVAIATYLVAFAAYAGIAWDDRRERAQADDPFSFAEEIAAVGVVGAPILCGLAYALFFVTFDSA